MNVNGPLTDYITIYKQNNNSYLVNIMLPQELSLGTYDNEILFYEIPTDKEIKAINGSLSKESINLTVIVAAKKQLEYTLNITKNKNNNIIFDIELFNSGIERIQKAKAIINIYRSDVKIDDLQTNEISLNPKRKDGLIAIWHMPENGIFDIKGVID